MKAELVKKEGNKVTLKITVDKLKENIIYQDLEKVKLQR